LICRERHWIFADGEWIFYEVIYLAICKYFHLLFVKQCCFVPKMFNGVVSWKKALNFKKITVSNLVVAFVALFCFLVSGSDPCMAVIAVGESISWGFSSRSSSKKQKVSTFFKKNLVQSQYSQDQNISFGLQHQL